MVKSEAYNEAAIVEAAAVQHSPQAGLVAVVGLSCRHQGGSQVLGWGNLEGFREVGQVRHSVGGVRAGVGVHIGSSSPTAGKVIPVISNQAAH